MKDDPLLPYYHELHGMLCEALTNQKAGKELSLQMTYNADRIRKLLTKLRDELVPPEAEKPKPPAAVTPTRPTPPPASPAQSRGK
jgi:hypothetical protein